MSLFGGSGASSSSAGNQKAAIMQQIQQQAAIANAKALVTGINQNCFEKCVTKPGASLSSGEEKCFTMCMEKFMAAWNTVSRSYVQRLTQENQQRGAMGGIDL